MNPRTRFGLAAVTSLAVAALWTGDAHAQGAGGTPPATMPGETVKANTATKGNTDIAKGGFVTGGERKEDDPTYVNDVSISAGGLFASGNARTIALTTATKVRIRRDEHQFGGGVAINYGRAGKKGQEIDSTVENYQGLLRYDYFLTNNVSLFLQSTARRDKFQGLDLRLNIDPGIAYYLLNEKTHRLWGEIGYDAQYDIRRQQNRVQKDPTAPLLDKTQLLHNARLFVGYENKLRKEVSFISSLEYLQNFADIETYRFIADIGLKSNIADHLALATTYTARYENKPLPDVIELDSMASFNLVYTLF